MDAKGDEGGHGNGDGAVTAYYRNQCLAVAIHNVMISFGRLIRRRCGDLGYMAPGLSRLRHKYQDATEQ